MALPTGQQNSDKDERALMIERRSRRPSSKVKSGAHKIPRLHSLIDVINGQSTHSLSTKTFCKAFPTDSKTSSSGLFIEFDLAVGFLTVPVVELSTVSRTVLRI